MITPRLGSHGSAVAAIVALSLLAGCDGGPERVPVRGMVTYNSVPIDNGTIVFIPEGLPKGVPKAGTRIAAGAYAFEPGFGPFTGKYTVEITWDKKTGRKVSTGDADSRDETKQMLPAKYNSQTTLTAEVKRGETKCDFTLDK